MFKPTTIQAMKRITPKLLVFAAINLLILSANAQPLLLKVLPNNAKNFTTSNGKLFYTVGDSLYRSNGTVSGTVFVKEIGEPIQKLTDITVGTFFYFLTTEPGGNTALWKSNGTAVNTFKVASHPVINPLLSYKNSLIAGIDNGVNGYELWRISSANVQTLIRDIHPGAGSGLGNEVFVYNDWLYFKASEIPGETDLWKSNGTSITTLAVDLQSIEFLTEDINSLTVANNLIFFTSYYSIPGYNYVQLWKTNGTSAGTVLLLEGAEEEFCHNYITNMISYNNKLYFDYITGCGVALDAIWSSDGTYSGTAFIKTVNIDGEISSFTKVNNRLVFNGTGQGFPGPLWRSDGTEEGTVSFYYMKSQPTGEFERVGNLLFFADHGDAYYGTPLTSEDNFQLYQSGLHEENTEPVKDIYGGSYAGAANLRNADGKLFFTTFNNHFAAPDSQKILRLYFLDPTVVLRAGALMPNSSADINAYPNPSAEKFNFTLVSKSEDLATADIVSADGIVIQRILETHVGVGDQIEFSWDSSQLPAGIYVCKYQCGDEIKIKKIIKAY